MPTNTLPRKKYRDRKSHEVPQLVKDIIANNRDKNIPTTTYTVRELTKELRPQNVPRLRSEDTVPVHSGSIPPGEENNVVAIVEDDDGHVRVYRWKPTFELRIGQFVCFWKNGFTYIFQIQMTDRPGVGKFVYVSRERSESQPGRLYRTTKDSKK